MNFPPPMWSLGPIVSAPHSSGPRMYPAPEECGICRRYKDKIKVCQAAGLPERTAWYRAAWGGHLEKHPHRQTSGC